MTAPEASEPTPAIPDPTQPSEAAGLPVAPPDPPVEEPRRYPSTVGGVFYLIVLAISALGIGIVGLEDWRLGIRVVGGALVGAAVLRLALPRRDAGMLAVRSRLFDALLLGAVGGLLIFLTFSIPDQPV